MTTSEQEPMIPFDREVVQTLRRTAQLAGSTRANADHLCQALAEQPGAELPPCTIRMHQSLGDIVSRARQIGAAGGAGTITRQHLLSAQAELAAVAAGLDLERLRFACWRIGQIYLEAPGQRQIMVRHAEHDLILEEVAE
jgi:hypothetical protein